MFGFPIAINKQEAIAFKDFLGFKEIDIKLAETSNDGLIKNQIYLSRGLNIKYEKR